MVIMVGSRCIALEQGPRASPSHLQAVGRDRHWAWSELLKLQSPTTMTHLLLIGSKVPPTGGLSHSNTLLGKDIQIGLSGLAG